MPRVDAVETVLNEAASSCEVTVDECVDYRVDCAGTVGRGGTVQMKLVLLPNAYTLARDERVAAHVGVSPEAYMDARLIRSSILELVSGYFRGEDVW